MAYYLLYMYTILVAVALNLSQNKKLINILLFNFLFILLALFSGLRDNVGVDFNSYYNLFYDIKQNNEVYFEYLNIFLVKFIFYIGGNSQLIFLIYAIITTLFFIKYIKNFSSNYYLSIIIFISFGMFYFATFNQMRQYLALVIFLYALKYIYKQDFLKYSLLILLTTFIHLSSVVLLPLYFFLNKKFSIKKYLVIFFIYILSLNFIVMLIELTPYAFYLNTSMYDRHGSKTLLYVFLFFNLSVILLKKRIINKFSFGNIFINMSFVSTLLMLSTFLSSLPSMPFIRINNYFMPYLIIVVALFYTTIKSQYIKGIYLFSVTIVSLIYFIYTIEVNGYRYNLVPYNFNFNLF